MTPINRENLEAIGFVYDYGLSEEIRKQYPHYENYYSKCRRFNVKCGMWGNNLTGEHGWNLHIDNSDMCSIAACDVEFIEQIQTLIEIYKNY